MVKASRISGPGYTIPRDAAIYMYCILLGHAVLDPLVAHQSYGVLYSYSSALQTELCSTNDTASLRHLYARLTRSDGIARELYQMKRDQWQRRSIWATLSSSSPTRTRLQLDMGLLYHA